MGQNRNLDELFSEALTTFNDEIDCLKTVSDGLAISIQELHRAAVKKLMDFVTTYTTQKKDEKEGVVSLEFESVDKIMRFAKLNSRTNKYAIASRLIPQNSIINLIICLDALVGKLAKNIYYSKPEILDSSDKALKFSELVKFNDIEKAREYLIETEIDALIRKSHADQINWFEKNFIKTNLEALFNWQDFIEICERRNLFVHSSGLITDQYINVCNQHKVPIESNCVKGKPLFVDKKYFLHACDTITEAGNKLAFIIWKKFVPEGTYAVKLNGFAVNLISKGNYVLALKILDFLLSAKPELTGQLMLMIKINKAQTLKWQKQDSEVRQILTSIDWEPLSNEYKLVHAVLEEDYEKAIKLMHAIGKTSDLVNEISFRDWPIFKEFRKQKHFVAAFNEIYEKPYTEINVDEDELDFKI